MKKKYYDAPQMEIVKLQHSMSLLQDSIGKGEGTESANNSDASMWFGYDIPSHSHSVAETNITEFLDPRIHRGFRPYIQLLQDIFPSFRIPRACR